jgi:hypothetical protein
MNPSVIPGVLKAFTQPFEIAPPAGYVHMKAPETKAALVPNDPTVVVKAAPKTVLKNAVTLHKPVTTYGMTAPLPF